MAEMDEEMEDEMGLVDYLDLEIDFEYEFDASKYFDFCRPESPSEARNAELWFETAASCPPSPFITKIDLGEDNFGENILIPSEFNNVANTSDITYSDDGSCIELHTAEETERGGIMEYESSKHCDYVSKNDIKFSKVVNRSTLMKPTASHLAKRNDPINILTRSRTLQRVKKTSVEESEKSCMDVCDGAKQEIKRQKLDGGHSRKVHGLEQQTQLLHKIPQKKEHNDGNPGFRRLKITVPKDPDLGTARRAERSRSGRSKEDVPVTPTFTMFRARPLNRKILEAPSMPLHQRSTPRLPQFQEFHLKTSERAMHHAAAASFKVRDDTGVTNRQQPHPSCSNMMYAGDQRQPEPKKELFKSEPRSLDARVLSAYPSKKAGTIKNLEINVKTEKKRHQALPVDLFNKLSLISEEMHNPTSEVTSFHPSHVSKENIIKNRGQDCKGLPSGEMRQKIIPGVWRRQNDHDFLNTSSRSRNTGIR